MVGVFLVACCSLLAADSLRVVQLLLVVDGVSGMVACVALCCRSLVSGSISVTIVKGEGTLVFCGDGSILTTTRTRSGDVNSGDGATAGGGFGLISLELTNHVGEGYEEEEVVGLEEACLPADFSRFSGDEASKVALGGDPPTVAAFLPP